MSRLTNLYQNYKFLSSVFKRESEFEDVKNIIRSSLGTHIDTLPKTRGKESEHVRAGGSTSSRSQVNAIFYHLTESRVYKPILTQNRT